MGNAWRAVVVGMTTLGCAARSTPPPSAPRPVPRAATGSEAPVDWQVPPEEAARPNPLSSSPKNLDKGRGLFSRHCTACHGTEGHGDGPVAQLWARLPKDLSNGERQARLTDGEIFWKISNGHRQGSDVIMPGLRSKLGTDDRWRIVLFVRTLRAAGAP